MAFLIAGKVGVAVDLMKGYGHRVVSASIYIHYLAVPRVPRRKHLLASRKFPPYAPTPAATHPLFFHPSITAPSQPQPPHSPHQTGKKQKKEKNHPREQVFSVKRPAERGELKGEGTDRGVKMGPGLGGWWRGSGAQRAPGGRETLTRPTDQVFDSITLHLQRADVTVAPRAPRNWKTNCGGLLVGLIKETSVLSAEGLKLI